MSMEVTEIIEERIGIAINVDAELTSRWNGRDVEVSYKKNIQLCTELISLYSCQKKPSTCSFLWGYCDPEEKKAREFEMAVWLHSIRSTSNEEPVLY